MAFIGWQFDVAASQGLALQAPSVPVQGLVRASVVEGGTARQSRGFGLGYCALDARQPDARLTFRSRIDGAGHGAAARDVAIRPERLLGPCRGWTRAGTVRGHLRDERVARRGPRAGRRARLRVVPRSTAPERAALREQPALLQRVLGFGYSQSGRFLRELVRDGFNVDERGRMVFDAMMISSAGAGGGSFNHRFAMPGQAGNSVLSILRPVDLPPFTDDGLLAKARQAGATPKIFYTFSSTEYWARAGSLTHTTEDGTADVPLADRSRLYFLAGTPHAGGPPPPARVPALRHPPNFADQRWVLRALLVDLQAWIRSGTHPPPSRYPTVRESANWSRATRSRFRRSRRCRSLRICRKSGEWTTAPTIRRRASSPTSRRCWVGAYAGAGAASGRRW